MSAGSGWPLRQWPLRQWPLREWPQWHRDNPAGLLAYVQSDGLAELLPGLPTRAQGRSGDPVAKLASVYEAFVAATVHFADEPVASTGGAQAIRPPDQVLAVPRYGNCLDLSVTFAGACLHIGLHPLIVVCDPIGGGTAHAVVVVWLGGEWTGTGGDRDYPAPGPDNRPMVLTEPSRWPGGGLRTTVDAQGQFVAVDITRATVGFDAEPASFAAAVAAGGAVLTSTAQPSMDLADTKRMGWRWGFGLDVGVHHRLETAWPPPGRPAMPPLDPPYQREASAGDGPLAQLGARSQTVPFVDRGELDLLLDWCRAPDGPTQAMPVVGHVVGPDKDPPPVRVAVVEGVGGAGKTRLAAQVAQTLAGAGWYTGFLTAPAPADAVSWLAGIVSPLLVVIDYVEALDTGAVTQMIKGLATRRGATVLLFTARTRGAWWIELDRALTRAGVARSVFADLALTPRHPHPARLFSRAYRRFTTTGSAASLDDPQPPSGAGTWTTLDLVMLAWVAARIGPNLPATHAELYDAVIGRELAHWAATITTRFGAAPAEETLHAAAAVVSLLSPTQARLRDVLDRLDIGRRTGDPPAKVAQALQMLLAQAGEDGLSLRPDPIADHLILTTFPTDRSLYHICLDLIDTSLQEPAADSPAPTRHRTEPERFCDNLTRAGETPADTSARSTASELATAALLRRVELWPAAFEVTLNRGGAFVAGLEDLAARDDTHLPLREINTRIPAGHSELRALARTAALRTRPPALDDDPDPTEAATVADALTVLAIRHSDMGQHPEALAPSQEAVTIRRRLAETNPGAYLPDLAASLNNLGIRLSELGRRDEALAPSQEAVTIRRRLAETNPGAHLPDLAASLNNLGNRLSELGRRDEALAPSQEAVTIYRRLAETNPGAHLPDLAMSLNNLGNRLSALGRRDEALAPSQEAVTIYRRLAETNPGAHLPDLAMSLNNLGAMLSELGRRDEALAEFLDACRGLDPGPRAELYLALARWRAEHPDPAGNADGAEPAIADLVAALDAADAEQHPERGARARRAVRAALAAADRDRVAVLAGAGLPVWATADLHDDVVDRLNQLLATTSWADSAAILRTPTSASLLAPTARIQRSALAALYSDNPPLIELLNVLNDIGARGLDPVLDELCAGERHKRLLNGWLSTATWTASQRYLHEHRELLGDERTIGRLEAGSGDLVTRQHLAIVRLAATMPLDDVYDAVLDAADAADAALAAIDANDLDRVVELWHAAPHLSSTPFVAGYLAAVLTAVGDQPDDARGLIVEAARQGNHTTRTAAAARLRRLAARRPGHADTLTELASLLANPPNPAADPAAAATAPTDAAAVAHADER